MVYCGISEEIKRVPTSQLKLLILGGRDRICFNICKCRGILQISFILFVIRFVVTSSKNVCTDFSLHVILQSHS